MHRAAKTLVLSPREQEKSILLSSQLFKEKHPGFQASFNLAAVNSPAIYLNLPGVTLNDQTLQERPDKILQRMAQRQLDTLIIYQAIQAALPADVKCDRNFYRAALWLPEPSITPMK